MNSTRRHGQICASLRRHLTRGSETSLRLVTWNSRSRASRHLPIIQRRRLAFPSQGVLKLTVQEYYLLPDAFITSILRYPSNSHCSQQAPDRSEPGFPRDTPPMNVDDCEKHEVAMNFPYTLNVLLSDLLDEHSHFLTAQSVPGWVMALTQSQQRAVRASVSTVYNARLYQVVTRI